MKRKAKELEHQITAKDTELVKLKEKMSEKAQEDMKVELKRAYEVLRHLKKKVGNNAFTEEYRYIMNDIREALGITGGSPGRKHKRAALEEAKQPEQQEANREPVNIQENATHSEEEGDYQID